MTSYSVPWQLLTLCLIGSAVFVFFVFVQLPGRSMLFSELQNAGHSIAFFVLSALTAIYLASKNQLTLAAVGVQITILFMLGMAVELAQAQVGRGASVVDLIGNSVGIGAGVFAVMAWYKPLRKQLTKSCTRSATSVAIALFALTLYPVLLQLLAVIWQPKPPVMLNFDQPLADLNWIAYDVEHKIVPAPEPWLNNKSKVLQLTFNRSAWPALHLPDPNRPPHEPDYLEFKAFNPTKRSINLSVRVKFTIGELDDEIHDQYLLPMGSTTLRTSRLGPSSIDARDRHVYSIRLLAPDTQQETTLYFDDFRLTLAPNT